MRHWKWMILSGLLVWLVPFLVALCLSRVRADDRLLFESLMPVVLAVTAVGFALVRPAAVSSPVRGLLIGVAWLAISICLDLMMFTHGPMKMSLVNYMKDIGLTYLMFPVITLGLGWFPLRNGC